MDNLTREQRSICMASVRTKGTDIEEVVAAFLRAAGISFRRNVRTLPGSPDFVCIRARTVIFVDGDFWHGFRFPQWAYDVSSFWRLKIAKNRRRDQRNFRKLRRDGWQVIRIWQHQLKHKPENTLASVLVRIS